MVATARLPGESSRPGSVRFFLFRHQIMNHRREDHFHRETHFAAGHHYGVGTGHEGIVNHVQQVGKIHARLHIMAKVDDHEALIRRRDIARDKGIRGIYRGHALKIDMGARELWGDVVHIIRHAAQDGVYDHFRRITAFSCIAVNFLNPL